LKNLWNFPEDCALAASPHVRYRDRSVLPLVKPHLSLFGTEWRERGYRLCLQPILIQPYCKIFQNLWNFPEDCALAASPHVRYRDRSVLPLVLALVFLALAIACLTVLYLLLRYRRRRRENDEERSPSPRRRRHFAYSPRYLPAFCFKLRYVVRPVITRTSCLSYS
jgi:hypothetical protein